MADVKITALTAISSNPVNPATFPIPMVDLLDNTITASGTTKKVTVNQILGAGGTATLASATITGAATVGTTLGVTGNLTVDTDVLKVDTSNDRVGIGTASPTVKVDALTAVVGNSNVLTIGNNEYGAATYLNSNSVSLTLNRGQSFKTGAIVSSNVTSGSLSEGYLAFQTSASNVLTERARFNNTGAFVLAGGTIGANGIGIAFPTTQSASSDANCLDDYEEGTFTATVVGSTIAGVGVYSSQVGLYTKVGNLVTVQIYLDWTAHTGTGNMSFGGLPFTTSSTVGGYSSAAIGYAHNIALTASNILTAWATISATSIFAYQTPVGGGASTPVPIDTSGTIILALTYRV